MLRPFLFSLLLVCSLAHGAPPAEAPVEVVAAEFGIFEEKKGDLVFTPTDVVPHVLGQRYGWVIEVKTSKRTLKVSEEYVQPRPNKGTAEEKEVARNLGLSNDKRTQVSERLLAPHGWAHLRRVGGGPQRAGGPPPPAGAGGRPGGRPLRV